MMPWCWMPYRWMLLLLPQSLLLLLLLLPLQGG
jgi:hypothetical protein